MFKRSKGFTLIELLIVVAIIGILAALLIPNAMTAMQRAKQKGTMADISTLSSFLMDFTTDRGSAPAWDGTAYTASSSVYTDLVPMYTQTVPFNDQWGNSFVIQSGSTFTSGWCGITPTSGTDDFAVGSPGRDEDFTFDFTTAGALFYVNEQMSDYENDLVSWNGQFVCRPTTTSSGT